MVCPSDAFGNCYYFPMVGQGSSQVGLLATNASSHSKIGECATLLGRGKGSNPFVMWGDSPKSKSNIISMTTSAL